MTPRRISTIGIVATLLIAGTGCTTQQLYSTGQAWQRNECSRMMDQQERNRCLSSTSTSYEAYKQQSGSRKRTEMTTLIRFDKLSEQQIWDIANPIMDNLMDASTQIDHSRHVRDFTDRMKAIVTPAYFQRICQQYQAEKGYFSNRVPVAVFRRPDSAAIVWKQSFTKAPGEFVAEMVLVHQDGRYLVDHVMVF